MRFNTFALLKLTPKPTQSRAFTMSTTQSERNIVIVGGGIIGSTSAYFLSQHPSFDPAKHTITLLEATFVASGASGKAGGLLAKWAYPSSLVPLSYRLHKELSDKHGGEKTWGYRAIHCGSIECVAKQRFEVRGAKGADDESAEARRTGEAVSLQKRDGVKAVDEKTEKMLKRAGVPDEMDWVDADSVRSYDEMGDPSTTAQVHPYQFTTSMVELAKEKGVKVVIGRARSIEKNAKGEIQGVTYVPSDKVNGQSSSENQTLPATDVILSAGPWTRAVLPTVPVSALRAHSVVIKAPVSAFALFTQIQLPPKGNQQRGANQVSPEIYARPDGTAYACGEGDETIPLPETSDLVQCDESRCDDILEHVGSISEALREGEVTARQACYLPTVSGGPIIGPSSKTKGLVIAAGHTCWGIQNGPGTGKLVSEIVWDGKATSSNIAALSPQRWGV